MLFLSFLLAVGYLVIAMLGVWSWCSVISIPFQYLPLKLRKCKISFMKRFPLLFLRSSIISICFSLFLLLYFRYVPIVGDFQIILIPLLLLVFSLTLFKRKTGILLFIFLIPITNSIPYFFHLKSAPIGLFLFLSLFLSLLIRWLLFGEKPLKLPSIPFINALLLIWLISFIISFLRYSNFFPFADNSIHEWVVNSANLRAGGAIFSIVIESLIIISGLLFLSILILEDEQFLFKSLLSYLAGLSISSAFSIIQFFCNFIGVESFWVNIRRVNGLASDPNALGISISLLIPFLLFIILEKKKLYAIPLSLIFIISLFLSGSRSGFLNFLIASIIFLYLLVRTGKKKIILTIAVFLIFAVAVASVFLLKHEKFNLSERLFKSMKQLKEGELKGLTMGRTILWKAGFLMAKDYPLSGVGLGAYIVELPNFYKKYNLIYIPPLEEYKKGHPQPFTDTSGNLYIQLLSETGITGLLTFGFFWFYQLFFPLKKNSNSFSLSALISFSIISLFGFHILNPDILFPVFLLFRFIVQEKEKTNLLNYFQLFFVLIFTVSFLISSCGPLSIKNRTEEFGWEQDYGLYREEPYEKGKFRWTKKGAGFPIFIKSPFFTIDLIASHPDIESKPVNVKVFISEKPFQKKKKVDEFSLREKGWKKRGYLLKNFSGKKVFLSFEVSRTWNPLKELGTRDPRNIGIGIGKIDFDISEEIGFYNREKEPNGIIFRWTSKMAFLPIIVESEKILLPVRVSHPDAEKKPVELIISINGEKIEREVFNDHNWYEIELDLKNYVGKKIIIGFSVSRTWYPLDYGINDKRELGVAIGEIN